MSPRRPYAPPCTGCAGTGRHFVTEQPGARRVEWETCTTCNGSGRMASVSD